MKQHLFVRAKTQFRSFKIDKHRVPNYYANDISNHTRSFSPFMPVAAGDAEVFLAA